MNESVTLRPRFGKILCVLVWLIMAASLIALVIGGDGARLVQYGWGLLLIAFGVWVLFWHPAVRIEPSGVAFVNLLRTRRISWPAIQRIDTKYALTLFTSAGRFSAWAAPAPSRMAASRASKQDFRGLPESTFGAGKSIALGDVPTSDSGLASLYVRRQWEALRDAGHLETGTVDGAGVTSSWHWYTLGILVVLVVATVLGFVL
jgi:hypothetical protein